MTHEDRRDLGFAWAPLNQKKDDTKPTWVIGAEYRLSVGKIMKFNRTDPESLSGADVLGFWVDEGRGPGP